MSSFWVASILRVSFPDASEENDSKADASLSKAYEQMRHGRLQAWNTSWRTELHRL